MVKQVQTVLACVAVLLAVGGACAPLAHQEAAPLTLRLVRATPGFANPESLQPSSDGRVFYVSNVNGEGDARDGNGFIARMTPEGAIVQRDWVSGLDAPKGMALARGRLFVSDIDRIVEIDERRGEVVARYPVAGARFLNDVALSPDGAVLASDSGAGRIVALKDGQVREWLADPALESINGLLPERLRLVVTTMEGKLLAIDWATRRIVTLASDLGQADGAASLGDGRYLVSEWPGRLFEVQTDGASRVVLDTRDSKVLLNDFLLVRDTLYVPNWEPGTVSTYQVLR